MQTHASEANETNAAHPVPAWREAPHTDLTRFNSVSLTAIKSTRLDEILKTPTWNTHVEINIITLQQQKWSSSWKHLNKNILSWCNNKLYNKLCVCVWGGVTLGCHADMFVIVLYRCLTGVSINKECLVPYCKWHDNVWHSRPTDCESASDSPQLHINTIFWKGWAGLSAAPPSLSDRIIHRQRSKRFPLNKPRVITEDPVCDQQREVRGTGNKKKCGKVKCTQRYWCVTQREERGVESCWRETHD